MNLVQKYSSSIFYTKDQLYCSVCKKSFPVILEIKNGSIYCWLCFYQQLPFLLEELNKFIECREICDVLFDQRKEIKEKERSKLNLKLRFLILKRDNFKCIFCGKGANEIKLEIDHIKPISKGGKSTNNNLQTLCFDCNRGKGNF